jgi:hypothetical protein
VQYVEGLNGETARRSRVSALAAETLMNNAGEEMPQAALTLSSNDEHGTLRVLHHSRRNAPEEKPVNGGQSFGSHHDQIGMLFRGCLHDLFGWITKLTQRLGCKSRLDQLLHALFE